MQNTLSSDIIKNIRRIQIYTNHLVEDLLGGAYRSAFKGKGMEFEEVREYQSGDEVRHIDWNVTARMNDPYIKNFREERELTVMLMIDVSSSLHFGSGNQQKRELAAEIAAVLAFSAIKNNDNVGLILFSSELELYLPPKKGVKHVLHVVREILTFKPKKIGTNIEAALTFLGHVQKKRCICFLLSDFLCPDFYPAVSVTARKHNFAAIAVMDHREREFASLGLVRIKDLESKRISWVDSRSENTLRHYQQDAKQHFSKVKEMVHRAGGGFISVQTDVSYINALRHYFQTRKKNVAV